MQTDKLQNITICIYIPNPPDAKLFAGKHFLLKLFWELDVLSNKITFWFYKNAKSHACVSRWEYNGIII